MYFLAVVTLKKTVFHWVARLGGPGLIALALVDNSFIPMPGGQDAATILLAAAHHEPWWYYAIMSTIGAVIGGYLTYRIGVKGGEEALDKKLSKKRAEQARGVFERYGFWSVAVGAMLPPPFPIVAPLIVAGALKYPRSKFLASLTLGRGLRYTLIAYLGHIYGKHILHWLNRYYQPLLYTLIGLAVVGGLVGLWYWIRHKHGKKDGESSGAVDKVA